MWILGMHCKLWNLLWLTPSTSIAFITICILLSPWSRFQLTWLSQIYMFNCLDLDVTGSPQIWNVLSWTHYSSLNPICPLRILTLLSDTISQGAGFPPSHWMMLAPNQRKGSVHSLAHLWTYYFLDSLPTQLLFTLQGTACTSPSPGSLLWYPKPT